MPWTANEVPDLEGKTFVVTGSNTGIGYATAEVLVAKGARVVLACRNVQKGEAALSRLNQACGKTSSCLVPLDLASLASVRRFPESLPSSIKRIDGLINNAGLMMPPLQRTEDGFEMQFGTNVLGHFALSGLLLPLLERAPAARVVWLGSIAHWDGHINFDNLNAERHYRRWGAYAQSKLADIMLAYELERRLRLSGASTISVAAHPGGTKSELDRNSAVLKIATMLGGLLMQTTADGALPSLRAATDPEVRGGSYYGPSGLLTVSGAPTRQRSSRRSRDASVASQLWQSCERLTGVRWLSD